MRQTTFCTSGLTPSSSPGLSPLHVLLLHLSFDSYCRSGRPLVCTVDGNCHPRDAPLKVESKGTPFHTPSSKCELQTCPGDARFYPPRCWARLSLLHELVPLSMLICRPPSRLRLSWLSYCTLLLCLSINMRVQKRLIWHQGNSSLRKFLVLFPSPRSHCRWRLYGVALGARVVH